MSSKPISIGLVGLSAKGSWASRSHFPYLLKSPHYKITALQNSSIASAKAAAEKYHLEDISAHDSITSLAADPNVSLIAISVKVPEHAALIEPALRARKDVFVEWPLAANLAEAEHLTKLAKEMGVRTMVGLQARHSPPILKAKQMIQAGKLGRILGTTMNATGMIFGPTVHEGFLYALPIEHGANLVTIPAGHAVDALCFVLGEFESLQAVLANQRPVLELVNEEGKMVREVEKTSHDYMAVVGKLQNGGVASVVYQGGMSKTEKNFYWEINGTEGDLVMEGPVGHVQMYQPSLKFVRKEEGAVLDVVEVEQADGFNFNVGKAWDAFAGVGNAEGGVTTFEDALVRHKMIEAIYKSDREGTRERYI
ncbi:NAD(P)-binding protein [Lepidopterella palustris CBS 459.81]|uniref:NAD(P)-binding protein n=1 Tax=Lepidopterella palustris CBS 459.81 TaxID=1314670 RepID=A0A8E2E659_9PEZI|nr:NAD(P)-binding protein [Lepidopterella palustris CBS 459.81]